MSSIQDIRSSQDAAHAGEGWLGAGEVNVGEIERWACGIGGGTLALLGLSRGGIGGMALALVGGALVYGGVTGHCHMYEALGIDTAEPRQGPADSVPARHGFRVEEAITVQRSPEELYRFWR